MIGRYWREVKGSVRQEWGFVGGRVGCEVLEESIGVSKAGIGFVEGRVSWEVLEESRGSPKQGWDL